MCTPRCARLACLLPFGLAACSTPGGEPPPSAPLTADPLEPAEAVDANPDPHVFETTLIAKVEELEIIPGTRTPVWTYNGTVPGPLIRVARGDRLIVHFENALPAATTIHWHGVRLPNSMDGVPGVTQPAVETGGTFTYDFVLPDAGTYWYHPHVDSAAQVGYGLYGPLVVTDPDEPVGLGREHVLVLSDMALNPDGSLQNPEEASGGGAIGALFGREGTTLLVNGKRNPTLAARAGERLRFRLINAAKSRYFQLELEGQTFTRIGSDAGLIERPEPLERVVVTAAQRADVVLDVAQPPESEREVRWVPYDRGFGSTEFREPAAVFRIRTDAVPAPAEPPLPELQREIAPLDVGGALQQVLALTQDPTPGVFALGINGLPSWESEPLTAALGETQVWSLQNTIDWAHPFHLHGYFFQVLDVNGVPPSLREWRDTVDVPVGATVNIAINFNENPGMWMFHCHILDHADNGMMGMIHVH